MVNTRTYRKVSRKDRKGPVPLAKLRTAEAVKTVVMHPRRLGELLNLLEDPDRALRGRAASMLARLSECHPERLLRALERIRAGLEDESAFVRWHLVYALGRIGWLYPTGDLRLPQALFSRLDDENLVVRVLTTRALRRLALRRPEIVRQTFAAAGRVPPPEISSVLPVIGS